MTANPSSPQHGIKDNHTRGKVADFLGVNLTEGSRLSVVSAYFTIYAYEALSKELDGIESLRFLFGEPRFIQALDPEKTDKKTFKIEDEGLELANRLQQKEVGRQSGRRLDLSQRPPDLRHAVRPADAGRGETHRKPGMTVGAVPTSPELTTPPAPTPPAAVAAPVRIQAISLANFRAFPGPHPARFELAGKNLLLYGENGAGKSSLFHALSNFFSEKPPKLQQHNNVFSGHAVADCKVAIELVGDTKPVEWTTSYHPCVYDMKKPVGNWSDHFFAGSDPRITQAALRAACIDYKSLLNTNFRHGSDEVNLFDIAVEHLLRDYPVSYAGQASTIGQLWQAVLRAKPNKDTPAAVTRVNQACVDFNVPFQSALQVLLPKINELLQALGWPEVLLSALHSPGLHYRTGRLKLD